MKDGVQCYQYHAANRLENVTNCAGTLKAQYWYDYTGRKIKAVENGVTTYYPLPGFESKLESGVLKNTTYFYANGEMVARKDPNGSMHYYHGDQLGSTSLITNSAGGVEEKTKYLPFGGIRSGGAKTKYLFNGRELASATGLYDYGARMYNPATMHFIQPDTILQNPYDPQLLNRYSYVRNNPVKYTDPSGHIIPAIIGGIAAVGFGMGFISSAILQYQDTGTVDLGTATEWGVSGSVGALAGVASSVGVGLVGGGMIGGGSAQVTYNFINGEELSSGVDQAVALGGAAAAQSGSPSGESTDEMPTAGASNKGDARGQPEGMSPGTKGFSSCKLQGHFDDHGSDFGAKTPVEYEQQANNFMSQKIETGGPVFEKIRTNGDTVRYGVVTQEFGISTKNGIIRTYFEPNPNRNKCTNIEYFEKQ